MLRAISRKTIVAAGTLAALCSVALGIVVTELFLQGASLLWLVPIGLLAVVLIVAPARYALHMTRQLDASREQLRQLIASAPLAIAMVDRNYDVELWNPAAEKLFGFDSARVKGRPLPTIPTREELEEIRARVLEPLERGETVRGLELIRQRADGSRIEIEMSATALRDAAGRIAHVVGFMQDLSDRRAHEREQQELQAKLLQAQKMEAVGRLAGGVAHDFNNLLTVITSYADFVLAGMDEAHPQRPDVEEIRLAADRAASLTRRLLAFSRHQPAQPQPLDLADVTEGALKMLRRLIGEDVVLETDIRRGVAVVEADPNLLEQVLINLAVNARDAMPRGGRLSLEVNAEGGEAHLVVEDTGTGMDEATRRRIFEPFFTTKAVGQGTGLGLSTVLGIVQEAGGRIELQSAPGKGTRFDIWLPLLQERDEAEPAASFLPSTSRGEHVLVVEDESAVRQLIVRTLSARGYTIHEASNGDEALRLAARLPRLDLVLSDVVMPGMSGPALIDELRRRRSGVRYLLMSGYTSDELERHHAVATSVPVFEKPFSPEALARRVREALDAPAAAAAA